MPLVGVCEGVHEEEIPLAVFPGEEREVVRHGLGRPRPEHAPLEERVGAVDAGLRASSRRLDPDHPVAVEPGENGLHAPGEDDGIQVVEPAIDGPSPVLPEEAKDPVLPVAGRAPFGPQKTHQVLREDGEGGPSEEKCHPGRRPDLARDPNVPGQVAPGTGVHGVVHIAQGEADDVGGKSLEGAPQGTKREGGDAGVEYPYLRTLAQEGGRHVGRA